MFELTTIIGDADIRVWCDEATARVLLPMWQDQDGFGGMHTACRRQSDGALIVAFLNEAA